jgi:predicted nucleic acid-binding protein
MIVISDNSPLSAFLAINRLDILKSMYEKIIIPKAVYQELDNLKLKGVDISPWSR